MFRSLYGRLMALFLTVLVIAMSGFSAMLYQRIREDKMDARLDELTGQARDIAYLAAQRSLFDSQAVDKLLVWKCEEVMEEFDAYIILFDSLGNVIPIAFDSGETTYDLTVEQIRDYLSRVVTGEEIRVRMLPYGGRANPVFTVGVPYMQDGRVLGAVFIHTTEQSVAASYAPIIAEAMRALAIALILGAAMILLASRIIAAPLREMAYAADRFAHGDFETRVSVSSNDEIGRLAAAFNGMAEDLDRLEQTRRAFVANVSHELRSPLTTMQGFVGGILDGTVPEDQREHYLNVVLDETRRLNKLITTLLDLSRIESGNTQLAKSRFDINELLFRVLARQEAVLTERGVDVEFDVQDGPCLVSADPDRIEQVLINLVDNAVKYMGDGKRLLLSARLDGQVVRVAVQDDGPGIAEEDLPFIFERFYKADKAHTSGKGTGLGLAIVKSILEQHGQDIRARNVPGGGARFEFTLERAY